MIARNAALFLALVPAAAAAAIWDEPGFGLCSGEEYRNGVYVFTDHVFDDRGADTDGSAGGDFAYPSAEIPYKDDAADLVEVRIAPDAAGGTITFGARLNTLYYEHVPMVAIGIADGTSAAAHEWPFGAGIRAAGARWVLTLRAGGGALTDLEASTHAPVDVVVENDTGPGRRHLENTLTATIDVAVLGLASIPSAGEWTIHAAAGLREGDGWRRPGGDGIAAPYDLAFVPNETFSGPQDEVQSEILASGDISAAAGILDFGKLPDFAPPVATGQQTRIYRSKYDAILGEGREPFVLRIVDSLEGTAAVPIGENLLGLYVPYAVWIPPDYESLRPVPLFFQMHGLGGGHLGMLGPWADGTIDVPAMAFSPNGRAGNNFYAGEGELDVMEGFEDLLAHYDVDPDRVYLSGISMGGFGTYRIATRYPDRFAAAIPLIGTSESDSDLHRETIPERIGNHRFPGGTREALENVLNLPFRKFNGQIDWLVNAAFYTGDVLRFEELGYDYQFSSFTKRHHEVVPEYTNVLYHQVLDGCSGAAPPAGCDPALDPGGIVRDPDPARVVYEVRPFDFFPELGLVYTGAYWVSGLAVRDASQETSFGAIDATSRALATKLHESPERIGPEVRTYDPTADPYLFLGLRRTPAPGETENAIDVRLRNLAAADLDLGRMAIDDASFRAIVSGDGPTRLALLGSFSTARPVTVFRDGAPFHEFTVADGRLTLETGFGEASTFEVSH